MGKVQMLKNVNDGIAYHKADLIYEVSNEIEKLYIEKGWAMKVKQPKTKKEEPIIEISDDEILETII
jgi:hypothetical protein